ncbi:hypothetical protein L345_05247, partial [Ophiophagus hannah]
MSPASFPETGGRGGVFAALRRNPFASFVQRGYFVTGSPPHRATAKHIRPRLSKYEGRKGARKGRR